MSQRIYQFDPRDVEENKAIAGLSYLGYGVLFFLPMLACPKSHFARFHANQALVVLLASVVLSIANSVLSIIPFLGRIFSWVFWLVMLGVLALWILGMIQAFQGQGKELPIIGSIQILK